MPLRAIQAAAEGMMGEKGITMIELVVVVAVIGTLIVAMGFSYQDWMKRYEVEKTTKELYFDLMNARMRAMERGREHYVVFGGSSYSIIEDSNESGEYDAGDQKIPGFPKETAYDLQRNAGTKITFNYRGLISGLQRIWVVSDTDPEYDCMKVSMSRVIMGRFQGGACLAK